MSVSKERRDAIRRELDDPSVDFEPYDSTVRALLDLADERDRYRALLIVAASVLSEDGDTTEDDARALYQRITFALEGKNND